MADHDLAEMGAALEIAIGVRRLVERKYAINDWPQPMQRDCPVHRLKISSAADADRTERLAAPPEQQWVEHDAGSRQARSDQADMPVEEPAL